MLRSIQGLHHVTTFAGEAQANNNFWTKILGLRRVKQTVNFDAPEVYHLYYGDESGTPGTVMTYFPYPDIDQGRPGTGEVGTTALAVPKGALPFWKDRLSAVKVPSLTQETVFGQQRLYFTGVDGDSFALVEDPADERAAWTGGGISDEHAIKGFHSVALRLRDDGATIELLKFMGYDVIDQIGSTKRLAVEGKAATLIDVETLPNTPAARMGTGTVHHIAFSVPDRAAQLDVRKALVDTGYMVTPPIDRDYFWSIYFRTPGGVLFEIATDEPGFLRDEDKGHLGGTLRLPKQHEHMRKQLSKVLAPLVD